MKHNMQEDRPIGQGEEEDHGVIIIIIQIVRRLTQDHEICTEEAAQIRPQSNFRGEPEKNSKKLEVRYDVKLQNTKNERPKDVQKMKINKRYKEDRKLFLPA
eukprot:Tbor_TRINITY_DN5963_c0_g1::TRINITY_DN5963_c0_g1_i1::g.19292::m.19292